MSPESNTPGRPASPPPNRSDRPAPGFDSVETERAQLLAIIDNLPDFIYVKDRQSRFLNANQRLVDFFGQEKRADLIGRTDFDFCEPELAQKYYDDDQRIIATGETLHQREEAARNERGQHIDLYTSKAPLRDPETGEIIGIVGIGRDITELTKARRALSKQAEDLTLQKQELAETLNRLRQAQSQLVQSEKLASLGTLTAGIAHEINNPINFVYAGVNSMSKDFDDVKEVVEKMRDLFRSGDLESSLAALQAQYQESDFEAAFEALEETLKDIRHGATRIKDIVAGLSKFSRMGKESWQRSNLHDDLESVLVLLKNKLKHDIELTKDFDPELPEVECFPGKLNQAFMNILSNAIDAIEEKDGPGKIVIRTRQIDSQVSITFEDNGIGMPAEVRSKAFDPFFTTKQIGKGTGLGLSITYSIVQDHHGELDLSSEAGSGTTFELRLPKTQPEPVSK
ncbi:ATP-binding protein [Pelagicoccus sp. SDUM812003]|uniref:sensor histidine kinase n=1 Tax=Pelagicoccus sp. SDUM812003 TaxID=3041267 RepID=UPI00280FB329|nr:ATP-binding protein [Pelagicoccus sp. SDUM812003]MDQ8205296.1 ATP-binding protein [Pelagicoccus sp. SDUM812003]